MEEKIIPHRIVIAHGKTISDAILENKPHQVAKPFSEMEEKEQLEECRRNIEKDYPNCVVGNLETITLPNGDKVYEVKLHPKTK